MADARKMKELLASQESGFTTEWLRNNLAQSNLEALGKLPGYLAARDAVKQTDEKKQVLKSMEEKQSSILPVVDENERFVGIVEQSRLIASMLVELSDAVENKRAGGLENR